jgi:hypothetical protein
MGNTIASQSAANPSASSKRLLPWLVAVAFFMESLDTTILNTAVPAISAALGVAPLSMKAVLASYTLSLAVFIPISGWMADRFGTRLVFASAIGLFTLGSFLCGISGNIHLLVACRILQGCGGAMMVPVGRLTLVRAFAKADLLRTMSFVSIPALVAPMLGPIAGGLIVGYLHWRFIFFLNIPIGLAGLILSSARRSRTHSVWIWDRVIVLCTGDLRGAHTERPRDVRAAGTICDPACGILGPCQKSSISSVTAEAIQYPYLQSRGERQLLHTSRNWWGSVSSASALPGRTRLHSDSIRAARHASGDRRHEHEDTYARAFEAGWISRRTDLEHFDFGSSPDGVCHRRSPNPRLGYRAAGFPLWCLYFTSVHEHEYPRLCGHHGAGHQ